MASKGQQVVDKAESQLGIHESPWGSNCGGSEKYQALYAYLGKCGWPWCGAFVGWCWEQIEAGGKNVLATPRPPRCARASRTSRPSRAPPSSSAAPTPASCATASGGGIVGLHRRQPRRPGRLLDAQPLGHAGGRPALAGRGRRAARSRPRRSGTSSRTSARRATPASASTTAAGARRDRVTTVLQEPQARPGPRAAQVQGPRLRRLLPDRQQRLRAPRSTAAGRRRRPATSPRDPRGAPRAPAAPVQRDAHQGPGRRALELRPPGGPLR